MNKLLGLVALLVTVSRGSGFWLNDRLAIPLNEFPSASPDSFTWTARDGSYKFGMQGEDQWRVERRDSDGSVHVRYAYRAPNGQIIDQSFNSGGPPPNVQREVEDKDKTPEENHSSVSREESSTDYEFVAPSPDEGGNSSPSMEARVAKPYGALAHESPDDDFVDTNSVVDEQTKSIVFILQ